jgi:hypothetical protein
MEEFAMSRFITTQAAMIERCQKDSDKQCLDGWSVAFPKETECYKVIRLIQNLNSFIADGAAISFSPSGMEFYVKGNLIGGSCHDGTLVISEKVERIIKTDIPFVYIVKTDDGSYYLHAHCVSLTMHAALESDGMRGDICEILSSSKEFGDKYL